MTARIFTADVAERTMKAACEARTLLRNLRKAREASEGSVVILDTDEWGTVQLTIDSSSETQLWCSVVRDGETWVVWYDGDGDVWEAIADQYVSSINTTEGVKWHRDQQPLRLHSLDAEVQA